MATEQGVIEQFLILHGRARSLNAERSGSRWDRAAEVEQWRMLAKLAALSAKNAKRMQPMAPGVVITATPHTTTPLADTGNHYPTVKACIDGLQDAGIIEDDNAVWVSEIRMLAPRRVKKVADQCLVISMTGHPREENP